MHHRFRVVGSVVVLTCLVSGMLAQGVAAREQNVCVSVDGVNYVDLGDAFCTSTEGNTTVAVGEESNAEADNDGTGNTAVAVGDFSSADGDAGDGDGNLAVAVGEDSDADLDQDGDNNTAVAVGEDSDADIDEGSDSSTAINVGNGEVDISDSDDSTGIAVGEDIDIDIEDDDRCFLVLVLGIVYELGDCG